jgi:CDP-glucose 4,6-dehydratase
MKTFWKDKKVLVTGGGGFVGSHLVRRLVDLGVDVFVLGKKRCQQEDILNKKPFSKAIKIVNGNVCDKQFINILFNDEKFNFCFHLAAQPLVGVGQQNPLSTFEINIMGTVYILEAARQHQLQGLILASTSHVYGENKLPFLEEYFPRPSRPYETSKACADILAQTYARYYKLPVAIGRFVNIYGPGDQNKRIVPRTIQLILNGQKPEIFDDKATRDYLYIDDAVNGYLMLGEKVNGLIKQNSNIIYNFGTGNHYSTKTLVEKIISLTGRNDITPVTINNPRGQEIVNQYLSIEKSQRELGWNPQYTIEEGLKKTIDWYSRTQLNI